MKGSMDWFDRGGPWTWGPCFVYVPKILSFENFSAILTLRFSSPAIGSNIVKLYLRF